MYLLPQMFNLAFFLELIQKCGKKVRFRMQETTFVIKIDILTQSLQILSILFSRHTFVIDKGSVFVDEFV